jgi:hypothetical protein
MFDVGLTHIALPVCNLEASVAFYAAYARMQVVHRQTDLSSGAEVAWLSDRQGPHFLLAIIPTNVLIPTALTRRMMLVISNGSNLLDNQSS